MKTKQIILKIDDREIPIPAQEDIEMFKEEEELSCHHIEFYTFGKYRGRYKFSEETLNDDYGIEVILRDIWENLLFLRDNPKADQ